MGRQAYMTRMAFGRSAYEPPEPAPPERHDQPAGSQSIEPIAASHGENAVPPVRLTSDPDPQQFNERGRPMNPRSRDYARSMRQAQNDVLALVGVCVRNPPASNQGKLSKTEREQLISDQVAGETMYGSIVGIVGILAKYAGVWWISSLRDRLMVFRFPSAIPFSQIVLDEYARSGPFTFFLAGFPGHLASLVANDGGVWSSVIIDALDELMISSSVSRRQKKIWQKLRHTVRWTLAVAIEIIFAPLLVHTILQKLHFIPASRLLPPLKAFIPFTSYSPIQAIPLPRSFSPRAVLHWCGAVAASPIVMLHIWRQAMIAIQSNLYPLFASSILIPDNPDPFTINIERREEVSTSNGTCQQIVTGAMNFIGWGRSTYIWPRPSSIFNNVRSSTPNSRPEVSAERPILADEPISRSSAPSPSPPNPSGQMSGNAERPRPPPVQTAPEPTEETVATSLSAVSPTSSAAPEEGLNGTTVATIRIADGNAAPGTVDLEIAIPYHMRSRVGSQPRTGARTTNDTTTAIDSSDPPVQDADHGTTDQPDMAPADPAMLRQQNQSTDIDMGDVEPIAGRYYQDSQHRVTPLSEESADMLATLLNGYASGWMVLPLRTVILRRITWVVMTTTPWIIATNSPMTTESIYPSPFPWRPGSAGLLATIRQSVSKSLVERIMFCCAIESAISFGIWGAQWAAIMWLGKRRYGWGRL